MQKISTLFLKSILGFMGLIAIGACALVFNFSLQDIPEKFPPITLQLLQIAAIGIYLSLIPFYVVLYQSFKLLQNIDKNMAFSDSSVKSLGLIKYSTLAMTACYLFIMPFAYAVAEFDDAPGLILFAFAFCCYPLVFSTFAAVFEKLFQNAVAIKNENDLTV